jgi:hypothetical protein
MDTDDLSLNAYNDIIITADKFNHNLALEFGVLAYDCRTDDEFLENAEELIEYWVQCDSLDEIMKDIFWEEKVNKEQFIAVLNTIAINIKKIREIPEEKREYDF